MAPTTTRRDHAEALTPSARAARSTRPRALAPLAAAVGCVLSVLAASVRGGEVEDLNKMYADTIKPSLRSDSVLLPLLAKMTPPPLLADEVGKAAMLPAGKTGWTEAAAWVQAAPQKAALEGLGRVTQQQEWAIAYAWGQPYGADATDVQAIKDKLYTELGDPPLLAAGKIMYLPALDRLACAVHVEATRLAAEKKVGEAITLLTNWLYFARSMCDRQMYREARWGYVHAASALERIRDVLYLDVHRLDNSAPSVTLDDIRKLIGRLSADEVKKAYADIDRAKFPVGNRLAAEQVISIVYDDAGNVDRRTFASTMSRLGTSEYPLRLFGEAGKWDGIVGQQARRAAMLERARGVYTDWTSRWIIPDHFDRRMSDPWDYSKLDRGQHAVIVASMPDMSDVFDLRQIVRTELVGTRTAAALAGATLERKVFPPVISAVRPTWLKALDADPWNPDRASGKVPPMVYYLPGRGGDGKIIESTIVAGTGDVINATFKEDTFLLFSVGSDFASNLARKVQNTAQRVEGADYLIWPPVLSIARQYRIDQKIIK